MEDFTEVVQKLEDLREQTIGETIGDIVEKIWHEAKTILEEVVTKGDYMDMLVITYVNWDENFVIECKDINFSTIKEVKIPYKELEHVSTILTRVNRKFEAYKQFRTGRIVRFDPVDVISPSQAIAISLK